MGHRGWRNKKELRALLAIKAMRRSSNRAIRKMKDKKGKDTEEAGAEITASLFKQGLIKEDIPVARCSFMDTVRKVDRIVLRLSDGMPIPIQFKSSFPNIEQKSKYKFFEKMFGDWPVFIIIRPRDDLKKIEKIMLQKINSWRGGFFFKSCQIKYNKFFDFKHYPDFGSIKQRKELFFEERKEIEKRTNKPEDTSTPQLT